MSKSKVMVITGTSEGIGRGIAKQFASRGYTVAGCSRSPSTIKLDTYFHSQVDVGDENQVRHWIRSIFIKYRGIDILVCNAGLVRSALLMSVTSSKILEDFVRVHINGTYFTCREASKVMIQQKHGRIITISSLSVPMHLEGTSAYTATKGAIIEMTKVLAKELSPMGITCNVVGPGLTMTKTAKNFGDKWAENLQAQQTIKRVVTIKEICNVISFFAAPNSSCITGQVINMCYVS